MSRRHRNAARAHHRATDPDRWMTVSRAAAHLGRTRQTIYAMVARGELGADHIAGRLVIRRAALAALKPFAGAKETTP